MPRKRLDACMFCSPEPCTCTGRKSKKTGTRSSTSAGDPAGNDRLVPAESTPVDAPKPKVDFAAAMRSQAEEDAAPKPKEVRHMRLQNRPEVKDDEELVACLLVLEPILHSDEKERYSGLLDKFGSRSDRWRRRNGST